MVRLLLVLDGAREHMLVEQSPALADFVPYRGPLLPCAAGATGTAEAPLRSMRPVVDPAETTPEAVEASHARLVNSLARIARADVLPEVLRVEIPAARLLRAAGASERRAHQVAGAVALAAMRVVRPEVTVLTWSGTPPTLLQRLRWGASPRTGPCAPGWRASVPIPAWTERDLLASLQPPRAG